jgi:hypothetical protein
VTFGKEHVPKTETLSLLLEVVYDGRVALPSCVAFADLGLENGIRAVVGIPLADGQLMDRKRNGQAYGIQSSSTNLATISRVFLALSLTRSRTFKVC